MKRLFLFLVLLASSLLAANATVVTGRVTFDYYGYPQSVNSGTVTLNQDGSVVYSASVVNGYDPAVSSYSARYTIDAVESGTYTIVFRGLGSGNVKTYTSQIVVDAAVDTLTHDIEAEDEDSRTPLHSACKKVHFPIIEYLISLYCHFHKKYNTRKW